MEWGFLELPESGEGVLVECQVCGGAACACVQEEEVYGTYADFLIDASVNGHGIVWEEVLVSPECLALDVEWDGYRCSGFLLVVVVDCPTVGGVRCDVVVVVPDVGDGDFSEEVPVGFPGVGWKWEPVSVFVDLSDQGWGIGEERGVGECAESVIGVGPVAEEHEEVGSEACRDQLEEG